MARYFDGTEEPPPTAPKHCPLCRGEVTTKWTSAMQHRVHRGDYAIAVPVHACEKCGIAVRIHRIPKRGIYKTRKAARESRAADIAAKRERRNAYAQRLR